MELYFFYYIENIFNTLNFTHDYYWNRPRVSEFIVLYDYYIKCTFCEVTISSRKHDIFELIENKGIIMGRRVTGPIPVSLCG